MRHFYLVEIRLFNWSGPKYLGWQQGRPPPKKLKNNLSLTMPKSHNKSRKMIVIPQLLKVLTNKLVPCSLLGYGALSFFTFLWATNIPLFMLLMELHLGRGLIGNRGMEVKRNWRWKGNIWSLCLNALEQPIQPVFVD